MHQASILSLLFGLASAMPVVEVPSMAELRAEAGNISKRQSANGQAHACGDNGCGDCPWFLGAGTGYPECIIYDTAQFSDITTSDENGQNSVFFDFPEPDPTCRWIVLTPAGRDSENCGTPVLTVTGAACQRVAIQSTFMLQFCCGTGDCKAAATKHRRDVSSNDLFSRSGSTGALYMMNKSSGLAVAPMYEGPPLSQSKLRKRDCGDFVVTEGPYSSIGNPQRVSDDVACPATGECTAELSKQASQSRTISSSLSVGDPWGVISASVGVEFTKESSKTFTGTFPLQEGASGYVVYTPYTQCYRGYFSGDCADDGQSIEVCYPEKNSDGSLLGQLRGVIIRT